MTHQADVVSTDDLAAWTATSRRLVIGLVVVSAVLIGVHLVLQLALADPTGQVLDLVELFDVHRERNVPTYWNTALLVMFACSAWVVAVLAPPRQSDGTDPGGAGGGKVGWAVAGVVALGMGLDEAAVLHERIFLRIGTFLADQGIETVSYRWVLPGLVFALLASAVVVRWSRTLPRTVRRRLLAALVLYGAGALGAEAVTGWIDNQRGIDRSYQVVTALEEALEMAGVIMALWATLGMVQLVESRHGRALVMRPNLGA